MTDTTLPPALPRLMVEPIVRAALLEDLGRAGDLTTDSIVPAEARFSGAIVSRQAGTVAGTDAAALAFALLDSTVRVSVLRPDGSRVAPGEAVIALDGPARAILSAERVALNLLCRLSGVATATASLVEAARPHGKARIVCTRKTTPGLRSLEKHAVRAGGGANHRFGLDDAVLIKDNHVAVAGGVAPAVRRARAGVGHLVKIEVEVDTLAQLDEALSVGADAVLLDNMSPDTLRAAVAMIDGRAVSEASGRISRETVGAVAATGVDLISTGWITHSAPIVDLGLDVA
ncbi:MULTISPECIES: carboxylating nicotinate-nucleotide diphosphorylase [Methylobacterium]|jgi:nicotinate-nucleotide pyrophosphorylase (carboxylating)|uniref:carboxylating nicotinate-nucleotide diphosphorylase n=1 Tax=Methylobacterium TaxID=407 RepID=UPI0008EB1D44|nr:MULTISPECIES: carboxylating nicotinate-nucleotide diphosphorylase [Methylobacterium]MBZ6412545.1 carboxylating nicotinate-nucleotide diphosphorylase [Methylobacterium sp.]MBK3399278.1 carboxylating nicotinate-nucleotide diphosphorylase [Methylobacterium ajmalii]MBK3408421.1 carboxylating nicotinate-nucleotide diphosphorylase [Methylobacterium ajmalii]MBK3422888.1 carboxylating nicotinate-nucleotide diphosphorylase [Methylobacterium ajmalii]SFF04976.1 nicotinate-nucleotide pyrophosphorylase 